MSERRRGSAFPLPLASVHGANTPRARDTLHPQRPSAPAAGVRGSLSNPFLHPDAQAGG